MKNQADSPEARGKAAELQVTLLATSDLHAQIHPHDYYRDEAADDLGLARLAPLVEEHRAAAPNCLLCDNGDTLQGTPLGDYVARERTDTTRPHPMIAAMNALGYDAATPGNHDFNYGQDFLAHALQDADFPVVLANVTRADGTPFLPPSAMLTRRMHDGDGRAHDIRIGVIGLAPPQITHWDKPLLQAVLQTHPIVATATRVVRDLRAAGADLVVALCHSGIGPEDDSPDLENAIRPLARLAGCDAIVAGHSHAVFPAPGNDGAGLIHGTPVVQPGAHGNHLGWIRLTLRQTAPGWQVTAAETGTTPVGAASDAASPARSRILDATAADHRAVLGYIRRRIGETTRPLTSYFALVSNTAAIALVAEAKRAAAARALQGHALAHLPLLAIAAPFRAGGRGGARNFLDIPAGPLSIRNIADLYIFPNRLQILHVTGADISDWLERAATAFHRVTPGGHGQPLIDHAFASYNFDVMTGLSYVIDPSQPARYTADGQIRCATARRIRDIRHQGRPITPGDEFLVVTNSYRAAGGGHFSAPARSPVVVDPQLTVQDVLIRHVAEISPLTPEPLPTWRFADMPGTSVIVETGQGAARYRDEISALGLSPLCDSPSGFARYRMEL